MIEVIHYIFKKIQSTPAGNHKPADSDQLGRSTAAALLIEGTTYQPF